MALGFCGMGEADFFVTAEAVVRNSPAQIKVHTPPSDKSDEAGPRPRSANANAAKPIACDTRLYTAPHISAPAIGPQLSRRIGCLSRGGWLHSHARLDRLAKSMRFLR